MGKRHAKLLFPWASLIFTAVLIAGVGFVEATADEPSKIKSVMLDQRDQAFRINSQAPADAVVAGLSARLENVTLEEGKPIELQ